MTTAVHERHEQVIERIVEEVKARWRQCRLGRCAFDTSGMGNVWTEIGA